MNFTPVLAAAKRAQAVYIVDPALSKKSFEALGHTWIGQFQDADSQAVLSRDSAETVCLSISGTRFSDGKLGDLLDDIDLEAVDLGDGVLVAHGAYDGLVEIWKWAKGLVLAGTVFDVCGHSLGGWRSLYTPLFLEAGQIGVIHAFESPKGATAAYWSKYAAELGRAVSVCNGRDLWYGWPFLPIPVDYRHAPTPLIWLQDEGYKLITPDQWPGGLWFHDHSIDLIVLRLEAIVAERERATVTVASAASVSRRTVVEN
jgi:hypothetical protein